MGLMGTLGPVIHPPVGLFSFSPLNGMVFLVRTTRLSSWTRHRHATDGSWRINNRAERVSNEFRWRQEFAHRNHRPARTPSSVAMCARAAGTSSGELLNSRHVCGLSDVPWRSSHQMAPVLRASSNSSACCVSRTVAQRRDGKLVRLH
jgi:hypothetical protein